MASALAEIWQRLRDSQKQRIYILPTRAGYAYAGLMLLMLLGAINYNNSLGHLLSFLLVSLGHVTMHHSHRNLRQLTLRVTPLEPVFCQQLARFKLTIINEDSRDRFQLEVAHKKQQPGARWKIFKAYEPIQKVTHIEADNTCFCTLEVPTQRRGWHSLNTLRLASLYPLGLFYSWTLYPQTAKVLVYPQAKGKLPLPSPPAGGKQRLKGEQLGDDDFAGLRSYREGEPMHRVAWKALARDNVMRSKQFSSPEGHELQLRWQDLDNLVDTEAKLSQLTNWVMQADRAGHRYGLQIPGTQIEADSGPQHQHRCLKTLALYHG
ncbi:DUF58 domain-containing protein [Methylophaga sp.]|uniref:DUF58 domain-containing protein n=1 Tax=Methylophaga sp. TaxID=2024840 RepID=UPI0014006FB1|nr:DUF58 domain-containing protein [Methylophaga sp.]MTI62667.1 DUF58 domain-containing protein [Methylophaga sp.]